MNNANRILTIDLDVPGSGNDRQELTNLGDFSVVTITPIFGTLGICFRQNDVLSHIVVGENEGTKTFSVSKLIEGDKLTFKNVSSLGRKFKGTVIVNA